MVEELSSLSIQKILSTQFIGRNILYYPELKSTMDTARKSAADGVPEGAVVIADKQTGGRGRMGRTWISTGGNIALSIILYPDMEYLPFLIMVASLAALHSMEVVTGVKAGIKWPNDILVEGKKVCGILIENEMKGQNVTCSIVGIGINVTLKPEEIKEIVYPAAGLEKVSGRRVSRVEVIGQLLNEFEKLYRQLPDTSRIFNTWRDKLVTLGKPVKVRSGSRIIKGFAEAVDNSGALVIREDEGRLIKVVAGEVTRHE